MNSLIRARYKTHYGPLLAPIALLAAARRHGSFKIAFLVNLVLVGTYLLNEYCIELRDMNMDVIINCKK